MAGDSDSDDWGSDEGALEEQHSAGEGSDEDSQCSDQGEEEDVGEEEDDEEPSTEEQLEQRRQANVKALLSGSLCVSRKPLLPRLLSVQNAEAILKQPFRSPHPNATCGPSETLRRKLMARRQFVPWGGGSSFVPLKLPQKAALPAAADTEAAAPEKVELPPGIEPLVLWEPPAAEEGGGEGPAAAAAAGAGGGAVVVDDMLTQWLRPHQREGVQFMFECVCGLRKFDGQGCILADDMGLGKTLQGISLLWTLLNSGHTLLGGTPVARRVIICCPTSLVSNWDSECGKWLKGRVRTLPLCESSRDDVIASITQFLSPRNYYQVLILSYETFRTHAERFSGAGACDLLICDEAHRLKNDATLTNKALGSLACRRRVLLSGTPLQNHLDEFYAMVTFCNPGVLGSPSQFRKHYELPILAGREPGASEEQVHLGAQRSAELSEIVNHFILRRTNSLLSAHLPPKVIEVVCCRMTPLQLDLYQHFQQSKATRSLFSSQKAARVLSAITSLRKLLNHPKLIYDALHSNTHADEGGAHGFEDCGRFFPPGMFDAGRAGRGGMMVGWELLSGKFAVLARMLELLRSSTKERIVIVSNFTQTLDLVAQLCREKGYPFLRLDGSTTISKRQKLVKKFNDPADRQFVFLLSSKAGGCGLNLIGGSRLVLFDPDWNPANDKQAAGRVWRDGQKRRVFVYRFLTTGTIEEKVYQRQLSKEGLQQVVNSKGGGSAGPNLMSMEELRDLFSYDPATLSNTYDSMCRGEEQGREDGHAAAQGAGAGAQAPVFKAQVGKPAEEDLQSWGHHSGVDTLPDPIMQQVGGEHISFVFTCSVEGKPLEAEQQSQGSQAQAAAAAAMAAQKGQVQAQQQQQLKVQQKGQEQQQMQQKVQQAQQQQGAGAVAATPTAPQPSRLGGGVAAAPRAGSMGAGSSSNGSRAQPPPPGKQQKALPDNSGSAAATAGAAAARTASRQPLPSLPPAVQQQQQPGQNPKAMPGSSTSAPRVVENAQQQTGTHSSPAGAGMPAGAASRPQQAGGSSACAPPTKTGAAVAPGQTSGGDSIGGKENTANNAHSAAAAAAGAAAGAPDRCQQQQGVAVLVASGGCEPARPRSLLSLPKRPAKPSSSTAAAPTQQVEQQQQQQQDSGSGQQQKRKLGAEASTAASKRVFVVPDSDSDDDFM